MGKIVIHQTDEKQTIIITNDSEGVTAGYYNADGEWTEIGGAEAVEFLTAMLTRSDHKDLDFEIKEGTNLWLNGLYARNVKITGSVTAIPNNSNISNQITGIVEIPTITSIGISCWNENNILATVIYAPEVASVGNNFFNSTGKANLKKIVFGSASPFTSNTSMRGTPSLKALVFPKEAVTPLSNTTAFKSCGIYTNADGYIYVPASQIAAYKADSAWSAYEDKIRTIEDYPLINAPTEWLPE